VIEVAGQLVPNTTPRSFLVMKVDDHDDAMIAQGQRLEAEVQLWRARALALGFKP
jgi:hypothetical protein